MTHPTTTLPADETSPTSPAPAPPWGTPVQPRPSVAGERRPGRFRRNLTTIMAASALVISIAGLGLPLNETPGLPGPQGPQGVAGPQGERGPAGKAGKDGKDGAAAPAVEAQAPEAPAAEAPATEAPTGGEFSDGTYKVGVDIQPGEYRGTATNGAGYWARLDRNQEIIDNELVTKTGGQLYFTVKSSDAYVEISGATFRKVG
jgi:hypothetical protein